MSDEKHCQVCSTSTTDIIGTPLITCVIGMNVDESYVTRICPVCVEKIRKWFTGEMILIRKPKRKEVS